MTRLGLATERTASIPVLSSQLFRIGSYIGERVMNYARVYNEFIADRRAKQHELVGYVERHHVFPRSLGGDDSSANIISLSADDHFRAHLLLAKIYGGAMWTAIQCMRGSTTLRGRTPSRIERKVFAMTRIHAAAMTSRRHADPVYNEAHRQKIRSAWSDPDIAARQIAAQRAAYSDPAVRKNRSRSAKEHWADPDSRAKNIAGLIAQANTAEGRRSKTKAANSRWERLGSRERWAARSDTLREYCAAIGIKPGKGFCNVNRTDFTTWLSTRGFDNAF